MTDTDTTSLDYVIIQELFAKAVCLTYHPLEPVAALQYAEEIASEYKKEHNVKHVFVRSKNAKIPQGPYAIDFHYFTDGTLIHCCEPCDYKDEDLKAQIEAKKQRIYTLLKLRGYPIKRVYSPQSQRDFFTYHDMLRYISERALLEYSYKTDLYVEPLASKADFVKECFSNGNILLTASKDEKFPFDCRKFMALFANGRYFVSEDYLDSMGIKNVQKVYQLKKDYMREYCFTQVDKVPQDYINALYEKAKEFDWYMPSDNVSMQSQNSTTTDELILINRYINDLFKTRKCLTVTNPDKYFMSPDDNNYAVFSDGLVVSSLFDEKSLSFVRDLKEQFPNLEFKFVKVSEKCLKHIYMRLPEFQKSVASIYIEILKQKARKLKRMLDIPHHAALDLAAKMAGWSNWKAIKIEDERHARQLIDAEKKRKKMASIFNSENYLAEEYKDYLKQNKVK